MTSGVSISRVFPARAVTTVRAPGVLGELAGATFEAADDVTLTERVRAVVTPGFTFRREGRRTDVDGYLEHVRELRAAMTGGEVTVLDEFVDRSTTPARTAARVTVRMDTPDGRAVRGEAVMIGVLDGDRLDTLHEVGRLLRDGDDPPVATRVDRARRDR